MNRTAHGTGMALRPSSTFVADSDGHRLEAIDFEHADFTARCSCGWRSAFFSSAGLAGAAHDEHAQRARRNGVR
jgi:hypothetical protein